MPAPMFNENDLDPDDNKLYVDKVEQEYSANTTSNIPCIRQTSSSCEFLNNKNSLFIT